MPEDPNRPDAPQAAPDADDATGAPLAPDAAPETDAPSGAAPEARDPSRIPTRRSTPRPTGERRGLLIVNTGDGKGKTTAALGLIARAHGRGLDPALFQFVKHQGARFGEHRALEALGVPHAGLGDGFSWRSRDLERSAELAREGWRAAREAILSGRHGLVVLDEATYPINWGWIDLDEVLEALRTRPERVHVVITGRDAPARLVEAADTVTEMRLVKHAFQAGVPAQRGIEH